MPSGNQITSLINDSQTAVGDPALGSAGERDLAQRELEDQCHPVMASTGPRR